MMSVSDTKRIIISLVTVPCSTLGRPTTFQDSCSLPQVFTPDLLCAYLLMNVLQFILLPYHSWKATHNAHHVNLPLIASASYCLPCIVIAESRRLY